MGSMDVRDLAKRQFIEGGKLVRVTLRTGVWLVQFTAREMGVNLPRLLLVRHPITGKSGEAIHTCWTVGTSALSGWSYTLV
jgi:hypothetical protein